MGFLSGSRDRVGLLGDCDLETGTTGSTGVETGPAPGIASFLEENRTVVVGESGTDGRDPSNA